jgi:prepilin-type N-terminal cleavage/methylation domain-containing protein
MMRQIRGVTLIEMLISMSIFAVVAFLTFMVVTGALRYNSRQQATVAAQAKLRRVVEVVSQEFRGALFGGISNSPYVSNQNQVSFYLLDQGAGYTLMPDAGFSTASSFRVLAGNEPNLSQVILIDPGDPYATPARDPLAKIFPVSNVMFSDTDIWIINHAGCTNGMNHLSALQAFGARSVGFRLDSASNILYLSENGQEYPMAFDITKFELAYVYTKSDTTQEKRTTPYLDSNNLPAKIYTGGSQPATLTELQFTLSTIEKGNGDVERVYTGQIPLLDSSSGNVGATTAADIFDFQGVQPCN